MVGKTIERDGEPIDFHYDVDVRKGLNKGVTIETLAFHETKLPGSKWKNVR